MYINKQFKQTNDSNSNLESDPLNTNTIKLKITSSKNFNNINYTLLPKLNDSERKQISKRNQENLEEKTNIDYKEELSVITTLWDELGITEDYRYQFNKILKHNIYSSKMLFFQEKESLQKFKTSLMKLKKEIYNRENNIENLIKIVKMIDAQKIENKVLLKEEERKKKEEEERIKREEEEKRKKEEEEEERLKKEEDERIKKEEEEKRKKDEEDRIKKEEEDRIKKEEEEKNEAKEIIINKIEEDEKEVEEKINEKPNLIEPKEENKIEEIKNNEIIIEEPKNKEINEENLDKKDNLNLRGKQKKPKTEDSKINIPDVIDAENDDKNAEMIRENNREPDTQEKERGKCGCILF